MSTDDSSIPMKTCSRCGHMLPATLEFFCADKSVKCGLKASCKECLSEQARLYYVANREERVAAAARYRELRPADHRECVRAYAAAHPEKIMERRRRYRAANSEKLAEYSRAYRAAHPEQIAEANRVWKSENHERALIHGHNRRAREVGAHGTHTAEDISIQYSRQRGKCYYCKAKLDAYHVDHVTPLAKGGSNGPENLVISCPTCNRKKCATHPMDFCGRLL